MKDWDRLVAAAKDLVRRRSGLSGAGGRDVASAMRHVMTAEQRADPAAYLRRLEDDAAAFEALIGELTVGETYFLREAEQLAFLRREVIPDIARRRTGTIRAWSAGCASGEEAYTLSMLFHEADLGERTRVLGTDIVRERLRRARSGHYRTWSFRGVPDEVRRRYFQPARGAFEVLPELRTSVDFHYLNLLDVDYQQAGVMRGGMDLILCRNVLIYLDADSVAHVAQRLVDSLAIGGWLLMAAADPRLPADAGCDAIDTGAGVIYHKRVPSASNVVRRSAGGPTPANASDRGEVERPSPPTRKDAAARVVEPHAAVPEPRSTVAGTSAVESAIGRVRRLADEGDLGRAGLECAAARERYPDAAELHYLESVLLFEAGNHAAAAAAARRALYLDPRLAVAHLALAGAHARLGRIDAARRAIGTAERLLSELPGEAEVPASGGATAAAMADLARAQLRLLKEKAS